MAEATQTTWISGTLGSWFNAANWTMGIPGIGDTGVISAGEPTVGAQEVQGVAIVLGGQPTAEPVKLKTTNATFAPYIPGSQPSPSDINTTLTVTGGHPVTSPLYARFLARGTTSFDGQIFVEAMGGGLVINAVAHNGTAGNFTFDNSDGRAVMVVTQESTLAFRGQTITNDGLIQAEGGVHIGSTVDFEGSGFLVLENGGNLRVDGTLGDGQEVNFADGTGSITIGNAAGFLGTIGLTDAAGNRIDLEGIVAESATFTANGSEPGTLSLKDGNGNVVATLDMQLVNPLSWDGQGSAGLEAADFTLSDDGRGGTLITYTPQVPLTLYQALPVPVVARAGTIVELSYILQQAFGTDQPNWYGIKLNHTTPAGDNPKNVAYWTNETTTGDITPVWYLNGHRLTEGTVIGMDQIDDVQLMVGNQINGPALFTAQVTEEAAGPEAEFVTYNVWSVDPAIQDYMASKGFTGLPTPTAVAASAHAYNSVFPGILNNDLCNWIGDNVAAGAGAPLPPQNFLLDPSLNQPGGFWRVVYRGDGSSPVSDWSGLVQRGDIVRMGWFHPEEGPNGLPQGVATGHTTTVLGSAFVDAKGDTVIAVYDNIDDNPRGLPPGEYIGIHHANYFDRTNPLDITIYRLDPKQQYLILGSNLGEAIQGSVYNDLFQPGGGADIITGGPGFNEVEGTAEELDGITVTDFGVGDSLDFTDLDPDSTSVSYSGGALHVTSKGTEVATVTMPAPGPRDSFFVWDDGSGGTMVGLLGSATIHDAHPQGYALDPSIYSLRIAATGSVGGSGVTTTADHPSRIVNLGTVDATGTGITMNGGGSLQNGNTTNHAASISGSTGVVFHGAGEVSNYGTIAGTGGWAIKFDSADAHLVLHGSSVLDGKVRGAGGELRLGNKAGPGTLEGFGTELVQFKTVSVDQGADWDLVGTSVIAADVELKNAGILEVVDRLTNRGTIGTLGSASLSVGDEASFVNAAAGIIDLQGNADIVGTGPKSALVNAGLVAKTSGTGVSTIGVAVRNDGTLEVAAGTLELQRAITGYGILAIGAGAVLEVDGAVSAGQTVAFSTGVDRLVLTDAETFAGKLSGFAQGDSLDLTEFDPTATTVAFQRGVLTVTDGTQQAHIALLGQYTASAFQTASDGHGGTNVTYVPQPEASTFLAASY